MNDTREARNWIGLCQSARTLIHVYTKVDLWPIKNEWPHILKSPEILPTQLKVNKLHRKLLIDTPEWDSFLNSEWKQLNWYNEAGMVGDPIPAKEWTTILPWVWTYLQKENPLTDINAPKA